MTAENLNRREFIMASAAISVTACDDTKERPRVKALAEQEQATKEAAESVTNSDFEAQYSVGGVEVTDLKGVLVGYGLEFTEKGLEQIDPRAVLISIKEGAGLTRMKIEEEGRGVLKLIATWNGITAPTYYDIEKDKKMDSSEYMRQSLGKRHQ
mgnify:CR=1 FL=1